MIRRLLAIGALLAVVGCTPAPQPAQPSAGGGTTAPGVSANLTQVSFNVPEMT